MNNLMEDVINVFGKNKKNLLYAIGAYVLVVIILIAYIWWPESKDDLTYENIDIEAKQKSLAQTYINDISLMFRSGNEDMISELISEQYAKYIGKSKTEIINELRDSGFFSLYSEMKGIDVYVDGDTYVYTTTIYYENNSRKVNIVETYPNKYTIVFDDFYDYTNANKTTTSQDIKFTVKNIYRNLRYIELNIDIQNLNKSYIRMDFNSPTCIQAVLEDGKQYSVSNLVSAEEYTDIESNTTISKNLVFEIPAQLQNKIDYIVFNGVILEFSKANIKVKI